MSRRLRTRAVRHLLARLEHLVLRWRRRATLACAVDGHAMAIAPHSADPHAGYGRSRGGLGRGYKLHLIADLAGQLAQAEPAALAELGRSLDLLQRSFATLEGGARSGALPCRDQDVPSWTDESIPPDRLSAPVAIAASRN